MLITNKRVFIVLIIWLLTACTAGVKPESDLDDTSKLFVYWDCIIDNADTITFNQNIGSEIKQINMYDFPSSFSGDTSMVLMKWLKNLKLDTVTATIAVFTDKNSREQSVLLYVYDAMRKKNEIINTLAVSGGYEGAEFETASLIYSENNTLFLQNRIYQYNIVDTTVLITDSTYSYCWERGSFNLKNKMVNKGSNSVIPLRGMHTYNY